MPMGAAAEHTYKDAYGEVRRYSFLFFRAVFMPMDEWLVVSTSRFVDQYASIILIAGAAWLAWRIKKRLPLPPGPNGLPIVGNVLDIPREKAWLKYMEWAKEYSKWFFSSFADLH